MPDRTNVACALGLGLQLCACAYESMAIPVASLLLTLAGLPVPKRMITLWLRGPAVKMASLAPSRVPPTAVDFVR